MDVISDRKQFVMISYKCDCCGYETLERGNAIKHKQTKKCKNPTIKKNEKVVMEITDVLDLIASIKTKTENTTYGGDHIDNSINITLVVPEKSVVSAVYDAVKNPQCAREIKYADPQEIPAILFKYTRGTCAEKKYIKYDADKNEVLHRDPVTGKEISKELKKYRNDYLGKNAAVYDHTFHIQYMPKEIQRSMNELSRPMFDSGKKKDAPIPGADVIKMCASGDHLMYKLPHDSKQFFSDVVDNVDREIKLT
jgi:hypothetical protein